MTRKEAIRKKLNEMGVYTIDDFIDALLALPERKKSDIILKEKVEPIAKVNSTFSEKETTFAMEAKVKKILRRMNVPAHLLGYQYVADAIVLVLETPEKLNSITKVLCPEVAERNKTTPSRAKRAIRHAIEATWNRANPEILAELFPNTRREPTSSEFIATVADYIRMGGE